MREMKQTMAARSVVMGASAVGQPESLMPSLHAYKVQQKSMHGTILSRNPAMCNIHSLQSSSEIIERATGFIRS
jgi:hypothetical protein